MASLNHDDIRRLMDEYAELSETAENRRRLACWEPRVCARDQWHGQPVAQGLRDRGAVPITVDLQNTYWVQLFPTDLGACYQDPAGYLRFHLQKRIEAFKLVPDDTPLDGIIPVYLFTPFETSLFGMPCEFVPDKDPAIDMNPVIHSPADLHILDEVDFFRSGMMPLAHRLYDGMRELVDDRFRVVFAEWIRGPFGVALYARGYQHLLLDLAADPDFGQAVLTGVTRARQEWYRARAAYLDEPVPAGDLYNDEVDAAVISPRHYRNHVLPHEQALAEFHGRVSYWHSCGNSGPMARDIAAMERIDLLDVSGWTDLEQVLTTVQGTPPALEVRMHPLNDVIYATPEWVAEKVRGVVQTCRRHHAPTVTIRCSGLQPWGSPAGDVAHMQNWIDIARRSIDEGLTG